MKSIIVLLLISVTCGSAQKQKVEYYIYNEDWTPVKEVDSAHYIIQTTNVGDSLFVNRIFKGRSYLWRQESFKDAAQTIPNGAFAWYDDKGRIDSSGQVNNGKKAGSWAYYDDTLGMYQLINYENGRETERRDYVNKIIKTSRGEKTFEEEKREKDSSTLADKAIKAEEREAVFKGGSAGYKKYLLKNLVAPTDIVKTGVVKLKFIINKSGKIEDLQIMQSLQLSADIEALRVLSEMPDWMPAHQKGKDVYYQAIQYITFQAN